MPLIPALRKQRQADLSEFEASLVYRVPGQPECYTVKPCLRKQTNKQKTEVMSLVSWSMPVISVFEVRDGD